MKWMILLLLLARAAFCEHDVVCSTQTTWKATQQDAWFSFSRVKLAESVTNQIVTGATQSSVESVLGKPNLESVSQGKTIWSYGLHRDGLLHVVFDQNGRVAALTSSSYRPYAENELGSITNLEANGHDPVLDAIGWKMLRNAGKSYHDRIQVAANCAKSLNPGMSCKDVESVLGKPDYDVKRGLLTYWIYRTRASTFLEFEFLDNQEMIASHFRHYNTNTGRLNCIPVTGVIGDAQGDELRDRDCWMSTVAGYDWTVFRTGISVRMATYIVPGMTVTEVVAKLGRPTEIGSGGETKIYTYGTSPASFLKIAVNKKNLVETVSNIMFPIP